MVRYFVVVAAGLLTTGVATAGWAESLFTETSKDFGSVPRGPELTHSFVIKNTTSGVVTLGSARVSCNRCSSVSLQKTTLQPGEETTVVARMYTSQFDGVKTIYIYVQFLQPQFDEVRLWIQANSRNDVVLSPDTIAFGQARRGSAPEGKAKVTFYGQGQAQVTEAQPESHYVQAKVTEVARKSGEVTYEVTAKVREDCPVGKWYTDVWLKTNLSSIPRVRVPLTIEIESPLSISPALVTLGTVATGGSAERKVIIRGVAPFKITEVLGGDDLLEITSSSEESKQVHVLTVRLKGTKPGELARTIKVRTDLKEENEIEFQARGQVTGEK